MTEYPSDPVYLNLTLNQTLVKIGPIFGFNGQTLDFGAEFPQSSGNGNFRRMADGFLIPNPQLVLMRIRPQFRGVHCASRGRQRAELPWEFGAEAVRHTVRAAGELADEKHDTFVAVFDIGAKAVGGVAASNIRRL